MRTTRSPRTALSRLLAELPDARLMRDGRLRIQGHDFRGRSSRLLAHAVHHATAPTHVGGRGMSVVEVRDAIRLTQLPIKGLVEWQERTLRRVLS